MSDKIEDDQNETSWKISSLDNRNKFQLMLLQIRRKMFRMQLRIVL